jgi:hypothetical protein
MAVKVGVCSRGHLLAMTQPQVGDEDDVQTGNSIYFNRLTGKSAATEMTADTPVINTIAALSKCGNRKNASAALPPLAAVAEANAASL